MLVEKMDQEKEYGRLELVDHQIIRTLGGQIKFKIPINSIKVIGEFTTADGPILDDWFVTILTADEWFEIPMYAAGIDKFFSDLGQELKCDLSYQLANSATWKTRIIYPSSCKDKELYKIVALEPKTLFDKIKKALGFESTVRQFSETTNEIMTSKHEC
jgi:hypothetical protein